jgi:hypothetical protein
MRLNEFRIPIFEINFNDPKLTKSVLKLPIQCGFEAESVWTNVEASSEYDSDYLGDIEWNDDLVQDNVSVRIQNRVEQTFSDWIRETQLDDYLSDAQEWWVRNNLDSYYDEFIESENLEGEFEEWSKENEDSTDRGEFINDDYKDQYSDWLYETSIDLGGDDVYDHAVELAEQDLSIDDWARQEYGSVASMLSQEFDVILEDYLDSGGGVAAVGAEIENWAQNNSYSSTVKTGDYHSSGRQFSEWGVENDASISVDEGTGAEIISPVYDTPEQMLKEMKSLFAFFNKSRVETNDSTGLHVTMSWSGSKEAWDPGSGNKLKMAVLLGDQYLLKQFNRETNSYTRSQIISIKQHTANLTKDLADAKSLAQLEDLLGRGVSKEKLRAIHFKSDSNDAGNRLIEFRIAGGEDYHAETEFNKIVKAVTRYATIMQAGYTEAYQKDYVKALIRLVNSIINLNPQLSKDVEQKLSATDLKQKPIIIALQNFASNDHYSKIINRLVRAYDFLEQSQTGQKELFEDDEETKEDWKQNLQTAQNGFASVVCLMAADIALKTNRAPVSVQLIQAMRNAMREFKLDYTTLWSLIKPTSEYERLVDVAGTLAAANQAINQLFKDEVAKTEPPQFTIEYNPQTESIFMPEAVYALLGSNTPPRLSPNTFKVISNQEYKEAFYGQLKLRDVETWLANRKKLIDDFMKTSRSPEEIVSLQKDIQHYEETKNTLIIHLNKFKKTYGFLPPKSMASYEGAEGEKQEILTGSDIQKIGRQYNIAFVPK